MSNPRETRCISAAFEFLSTAEFCQLCTVPGDRRKPRLDSDSSEMTTSSDSLPQTSVTRSDSDTALLLTQHTQEGGGGGKVVCLCAEREMSCAVHYSSHGGAKKAGDFLQGYIDRYATGSGGDGGSGGIDGDGETDVTLRRRLERNRDGGTDVDSQLNWDIHHFGKPGRKEVGQFSYEGNPTVGVCLRNCEQNGGVQDSAYHQLGINSTISTTTGTTHSSELHAASIIDHTNAQDALRSINCVSGKQEPCDKLSISAGQGFGHGVTEDSCASASHEGSSQEEQTSSSAGKQSGSSAENQTLFSMGKQTEEKEEEEMEEEVVMRPNRHLIHRRSTDTGLISSAFGFLPSGVDSVFWPSDGQGQTEAAGGQTGSSTTGSSADAESETCTRVNGSGSRSGDGGEVRFGMEGEGEEMYSSVRKRRGLLSKQDSVIEEDNGSGDSSDDDAGVYSESFRRSNWIRIDDNGELELAFPAVTNIRLSAASRSSAMSRSPGTSRSSSWSADMVDYGRRTPSPCAKGSVSDEQAQTSPSWGSGPSSPRLYLFHKRSDSTSTTLSEKEFKKEYVTRRKCLIQRQNSSKEYHRFSASVYDEEKILTLEKDSGEQDFGLHILDSQPAFITRVDPGSAADRAGVEEGQILVAVNGTNVLSLSHDDIVALIMNSPSVIHVSVAMSDFQPSRDLQAAVVEGYMQKLGGSSSILIRRWKKRYFVLRQDSCLYYYKQKDDSDPLGAIPLGGYTFSRHLDSGKDYCFKAEKYGARTYYFMTESRDIMTEWVGALSEAAAKSKQRKDSFVSVSSHNVGLPALEIRRPECSGYLLKVGNRHKTWHRRYCILKDACLYYYKNVNSLSALGVAHLHGYKVDPFPSNGKRHPFAVLPPIESLRTFQFSAENETDRERWVTAMIRSIQRWIQIDNDC